MLYARRTQCEGSLKSVPTWLKHVTTTEFQCVLLCTLLSLTNHMFWNTIPDKQETYNFQRPRILYNPFHNYN